MASPPRAPLEAARRSQPVGRPQPPDRPPANVLGELASGAWGKDAGPQLCPSAPGEHLCGAEPGTWLSPRTPLVEVHRPLPRRVSLSPISSARGKCLYFGPAGGELLVTTLLPRAVGARGVGASWLHRRATQGGRGRQSPACGRGLPEEVGVECFLESLHLSWRKDTEGDPCGGFPAAGRHAA